MWWLLCAPFILFPAIIVVAACVRSSQISCDIEEKYPIGGNV